MNDHILLPILLEQPDVQLLVCMDAVVPACQTLHINWKQLQLLSCNSRVFVSVCRNYRQRSDPDRCAECVRL